MGNWKIELEEYLKEKEDTLAAICIRDSQSSNLYEKDRLEEAFELLDREFDDGYGGPEGDPFYAWGEKFVYFCQCYDGSEWIELVPRHPGKNTPFHFGGY